MKHSILGLLTLIFTTAGSPGQACEEGKELKTVPYVDLNRYVGKWYEIARYENSFQKNCTGTTAEYKIREDGNISVTNRCYKNEIGGKVKEATGKAWVTDRETNAKLKVQFFWPFSGKYWIIELGEQYEYALIGEPSREYLWILSRTPKLDQGKLDSILERLPEYGYDASKLLYTVQE